MLLKGICHYSSTRYSKVGVLKYVSIPTESSKKYWNSSKIFSSKIYCTNKLYSESRLRTVFLKHRPSKGPRLILKNKTIGGGTYFLSQNILRKSSKPPVCLLNTYDSVLLWKFWNSKTIKSITSADDIGQAYIRILYNQETKTEIKIVCRPNPTSWKVELFFPNRQICVVDIQSNHIYVHLIWSLKNNVVLIHISILD